MPKHRDTNTAHHIIDISKESFRSSRYSAVVSALSVLVGISYGVIGEKISALYNNFNSHDWGETSLASIPKTTHNNDDIYPQIAASKIGKAAGKQDILLTEIEQYEPYFDQNIARRHKQFKTDVVNATKEAFFEELPHDASYYINENNFDKFIKTTLPTLFAEHRIAVQFHEYDINCKGAPPSLRFNLEIAHVDFHGLKSETLWGNTVQRKTTKLGTNYSKIKGSEHQYTINDWLGMYSKKIFINQGEILGEYQSKLKSAEIYLYFDGSSIDPLAIQSSGTMAKTERKACEDAIRYCAKSIFGNNVKYNKFTEADLTSEVKFHEFGHAWREDNVPWLKLENQFNRSVTEEAFAYSAEIGHAPRVASILLDLLEAKYISKSYEPHIQAKRLVFDLLVEEVIKSYKENSPNYRSEDEAYFRSEAISSLPYIMEEYSYRKKISKKLNDVLVEKSKLTIQNMLQEYSTSGNPVNILSTAFGLFYLSLSIQDRVKGKQELAIKKATLKIDSLNLDKDLKEKIKSSLSPYSLLDEETFESKRNAINELALSADLKAVEVSLMLCRAYWNNLQNNKAFMKKMTGLNIKTNREFTAYMLAPSLLEKFANPDHEETLSSKVVFSLRKSSLFTAKGNCFSIHSPEVHSEYIDIMVQNASIKDNMPKEFVYLILGLKSIVSPYELRYNIDEKLSLETDN